MRTARLLPLVLASLATPLLAQAPRVVLEAADGRVEERELAGLELDDPRDVGAHLVRFRGLARDLSARAPRAEVRLASGDVLHARVTGGREEVLELELLGDVAFGLSIDRLRSIRFAGRVPEGWGGELEPAPSGDRLYRRTHSGLDRIDGTLLEFGEDGVLLEGVLGEKRFPWDEVAALFVEVLDEDGRGAKRGNVPVVVDLADHSRLSGALHSLDGRALELRVADTLLRFPLWTVSEVLVDDGTLRFLSDLAPDVVEERSPFGDDLGMRWPYRVDRSVTGEPLRAGGVEYARGLGVHAPSRLTWRLDGAWRALRGRVALDDQVQRLPAHGSVVFRVLLDGEEVWKSAVLRGGDAPVALPELALGEARELTLEVDMATDFHVADRADWLRVLLVK